MTQDDAPSAVEQFDRDAACSACALCNEKGIGAYGLCSHAGLTAAFAAHRLSARQAALAEAAGIAEEIGRNPGWQSPIARETVRCAAEEIAEAILAAAGRS